MTKLTPSRTRLTAAQREKADRLQTHARRVTAERKKRFAVKQPRRSESSLQLSVIREARNMGFFVVKVRAAGRRGVPDLLLISPKGAVSFMELKVAGGKVSPLQALFQRKLAAYATPVHQCWNKADAVNALYTEAQR